MIITRLMGGLGNQMFQYALGRRLAQDRGVPLKLDISWFGDPQTSGIDTMREYALSGWRIQASFATVEDVSRVTGRQGILARLGLIRSPVIQERGFAFDAGVFRAPNYAYLTGYWQSEEYFRSIRPTLLEDFTLAAPPCRHVEALLDQVRNRSAVAVHVRRGDYVRNPATNEFHGLCSIEYYAEAARRVAERVANPWFFAFSDDPDWVRDNLELDWPMTVVTHGSDCSPHQDIWLMSQCAHHIIANSSFSWWGAWLCSNGNKVVIAPKRWFRDPKVNTDDLIPQDWTRI